MINYNWPRLWWECLEFIVLSNGTQLFLDPGHHRFQSFSGVNHGKTSHFRVPSFDPYRTHIFHVLLYVPKQHGEDNRRHTNFLSGHWTQSPLVRKGFSGVSNHGVSPWPLFYIQTLMIIIWVHRLTSRVGNCWYHSWTSIPLRKMASKIICYGARVQFQILHMNVTNSTHAWETFCVLRWLMFANASWKNTERTTSKIWEDFIEKSLQTVTSCH